MTDWVKELNTLLQGWDTSTRGEAPTDGDKETWAKWLSKEKANLKDLDDETLKSCGMPLGVRKHIHSKLEPSTDKSAVNTEPGFFDPNFSSLFRSDNAPTIDLNNNARDLNQSQQNFNNNLTGLNSINSFNNINPSASNTLKRKQQTMALTDQHANNPNNQSPVSPSPLFLNTRTFENNNTLNYNNNKNNNNNNNNSNDSSGTPSLSSLRKVDDTPINPKEIESFTLVSQYLTYIGLSDIVKQFHEKYLYIFPQSLFDLDEGALLSLSFQHKAFLIGHIKSLRHHFSTKKLPFVNETELIKRIVETFLENMDLFPNTSMHNTQKFKIIVAAQMFGSGKTHLAENLIVQFGKIAASDSKWIGAIRSQYNGLVDQLLTCRYVLLDMRKVSLYIWKVGIENAVKLLVFSTLYQFLSDDAKTLAKSKFKLLKDWNLRDIVEWMCRSEDGGRLGQLFLHFDEVDEVTIKPPPTGHEITTDRVELYYTGLAAVKAYYMLWSVVHKGVITQGRPVYFSGRSLYLYLMGSTIYQVFEEGQRSSPDAGGAVYCQLSALSLEHIEQLLDTIFPKSPGNALWARKLLRWTAGVPRLLHILILDWLTSSSPNVETTTSKEALAFMTSSDRNLRTELNIGDLPEPLMDIFWRFVAIAIIGLPINIRSQYRQVKRISDFKAITPELPIPVLLMGQLVQLTNFYTTPATFIDPRIELEITQLLYDTSTSSNNTDNNNNSNTNNNTLNNNNNALSNFAPPSSFSTFTNVNNDRNNDNSSHHHDAEHNPSLDCMDLDSPRNINNNSNNSNNNTLNNNNTQTINQSDYAASILSLNDPTESEERNNKRNRIANRTLTNAPPSNGSKTASASSDYSLLVLPQICIDYVIGQSTEKRFHLLKQLLALANNDLAHGTGQTMEDACRNAFLLRFGVLESDPDNSVILSWGLMLPFLSLTSLLTEKVPDQFVIKGFPKIVTSDISRYDNWSDDKKLELEQNLESEPADSNFVVVHVEDWPRLSELMSANTVYWPAKASSSGDVYIKFDNGFCSIQLRKRQSKLSKLQMILEFYKAKPLWVDGYFVFVVIATNNIDGSSIDRSEHCRVVEHNSKVIAIQYDSGFEFENIANKNTGKSEKKKKKDAEALARNGIDYDELLKQNTWTVPPKCQIIMLTNNGAELFFTPTIWELLSSRDTTKFVQDTNGAPVKRRKTKDGVVTLGF
eukprot:TRINITY_DN69_c0_g1_i1.p1 TRINITY_DN69_c0_g1~~TRINITY_DN69_c0_g1_i1.p1  ORF type:complete len:1199 (+),score=178.50 TRINITY_DN69_c0_g1_i1:804-4400(+)